MSTIDKWFHCVSLFLKSREKTGIRVFWPKCIDKKRTSSTHAPCIFPHHTCKIKKKKKNMQWWKNSSSIEETHRNCILNFCFESYLHFIHVDIGQVVCLCRKQKELPRARRERGRDGMSEIAHSILHREDIWYYICRLVRFDHRVSVTSSRSYLYMYV